MTQFSNSKNVSMIEEARQFTAREMENDENGFTSQANRIEDVITRGRDSGKKKDKQFNADKDNQKLPRIGTSGEKDKSHLNFYPHSQRGDYQPSPSAGVKPLTPTGSVQTQENIMGRKDPVHDLL